MISKGELINHLTDHNLMTYNATTDELTSIEHPSLTLKADEFVESYKKRTGQSFEGIYNEHVLLFNVIKCTECGTIIFEHYDEDYEHNLKCPTCTDYKTGFKFYTAKDIEEDINKQEEINGYIEMDKIQQEADERYIKRGNLYDWQRTHKKTIFKNKDIHIEIQLTGRGWKDLETELWVWRDNILSKHIYIPLSLYGFYRQFIYRHLGKCYKDIRSKLYIGKARN